MTFRTLILRSLRFHARAHLGVLLGAAVGSAALIGALVVGDSVRGSLRDLALQRLGNIRFAMDTGDRFFRASLANISSRGLAWITVSTDGSGLTNSGGTRVLMVATGTNSPARPTLIATNGLASAILT